MKRYFLVIISAIFSLGGMYADNISVTNIEIEAGETKTVSVCLENTETNLVGFQMDITLPEGITINKSGCALSSRFTDNDQELTIGKQAEGTYRLTSTSLSLNPISGTSGELLTIALTAGESTEGGTANFSNIRFVTSNSERITLSDVSFTISIAITNITFADENVKAICVANWDTNGDGELSYVEAAAVTDLGEVFKRNSNITSLDELQYFTGLASIGSEAFYMCSGLTSVTIPNSVMTIGEYAFSQCRGLTSINIPNSVTTIGRIAFPGCSGLASITVESGNDNYDSREGCNAIIETSTNTLIAGCKSTVIPNSVTTIGSGAFAGCTGLTSINIPNSVTTIRGNAFVSCSSLTSINIPNSVTTIGEYAFERCSSLTSIIIPNSVTTIGEYAFSDCSSLTSITVESGNDNYDSREGCNAIIETSTNTLIAGCKSTVIPNSVTTIGKSAFSQCRGLTSINIPNSVTTIGLWAFFGCNGLTNINIPNSVTTIGKYAFSGCNNLTVVKVGMASPMVITSNTFSNRANATLYVPKGSKAAYEAADYWKDFKEIVEYATDDPITFADENVKAICVANWDTNGDGELSYVEAAAVTDLGQVFKSNNSINSFDELQYFTGLTSIGYSAFYWCSSLMNITIPSSVTFIDGSAFESCCGLMSISVEDGNTVYDSRNNCNAIIETSSNTLILGCKNTVIPNGVASIGSYAFFRCFGLTNIAIPSSLTSIGERAFYWCSNLASIVIPNSVTSIGNSAFRNCPSLTSISVENGNTMYDSRDNCNAIIETSSNTLIAGCKNTMIPSSVTSIGDNAFADCSSLTGITIPNSVTSICNWAFYGCSGLTSITIPNSVTSIGMGAFEGCSGLTSVTIPNSVTSIGDWAFYFCGGLTSIEIPNSVTNIGGNAFTGCNNLTEVIVHNPNPDAISGSSFPNRANATLYVPKGSKEAYEAADYWKEFKEIVEIQEPNRLETDTLKIMTGRTKSMSLSLENQDEIIMVEFELQLPDGFEIAKDEDGELIAELNSERVAKSHTLEVADHGNGKYKFLLYSSKNAALKGNTGELLHFDITCGKDVADGTYQATVSSIILSDTQENGIYPSDFTFDIIAVNAIPGDVNGDENINGLDIVKIVGYIMGSPTQPFVEAAADLNEDEVINGLDLVKLVSLVLSQSSTQSAAGAKAMRAAVRVAEKELQLDEEGHGMLRMGTAEAGRYILSQFTVVTDGSVSINDITTDGSHVVAYRQTEENRYAVVCYSQTNATFMMNSDIMKIHYTGNGSISIQDAMMVDEDENLVRFGNVSNLGTTGIDGIVSDITPADIYTLGGKLVKKNATTMKGLPRGTYIVNGQKISIK